MGQNADSGRAFNAQEGVLAFLAFSVLSAIFFGGALTRDFLFRDPFFEFYPLRLLWSYVLTDGEFPLWNPFVGLGVPLSGAVYPGLFYPLNLPLFLVLGASAQLAVRFYIIIHYPLAATAMFFFLRKLGLQREGAAAGAIAYAFSGYLVSMHYAMNLLPGFALTPLALGFAVWAGPWWACAVLSGGAAGLIFVGGDPQGFAVTVVLAPFVQFFLGPSEPWRRRAAGAALTAGFAFSCGAVEILPALTVLRESGRAAGLDFNAGAFWSFHPARLIELFLANPFGHFWPINRYRGTILEPGATYPMALSVYLGFPVLALAAAALRSKTAGRRIIFFIALATGFLVLSLGGHTPVFSALYETLPGLRAFRFPEKYFFFVSLSLAALAGLGLDSLLRSASPKPGKWLFAWWFVAIASAASFFAIRLLKPESAALADISCAAARSFFFLALFIPLLATARSNLHRFSRWLPALLIFLDLLTANRGLAPTGEGLYRASSRMNDAILSRVSRPSPPLPPWCEPGDPCVSPGHFRISRDNADPYPFGFLPKDAQGHDIVDETFFRRWELDTLKPNLGVIYGMENLNGISAAASRRFELIIPGSVTIDLLTAYNTRFLFLPSENADEVWPGQAEKFAEFEGEAVFELKEVMPRAYWIGAEIKAKGRDEVMARMQTREFRQRVVIEGEGPTSGPSVSRPPVPAKIIEYLPNRAEIDVDAPADGWLVLNDAYYPGWRAQVDGASVKIYRANYLVRAVRVPSGRHRVSFSYHPRGLLPGSIISLLAWTGVLVVLWWERSNKMNKTGMDRKG